VKKWYWLNWKYLGVYKMWPQHYVNHDTAGFIIHPTKESAEYILSEFFPKKVK
jgi:hypothetical protein